MMARITETGDWAPDRLAARAAAADTRADDALSIAVADFLLADSGRLDDRTRLALREAVRAAVGGVDGAIRRHAARSIADRDGPGAAEALLAMRLDVTDRLIRAGVLRDEDLLGELLAHVRHDLLAEALPVAVRRADEPSLLVRLVNAPDAVVARAATALLVADNRRHDADVGASDLSAESCHRLVWWVAAAIAEAAHADGAGQADAAIVEAAQRCLAAHDEGDRTDAIAMRLAAALEPRPAELPDLLVEAIGDRRLALFTALLAQATGLPHDTVRMLVLEADGDRLWLALRAIDLPRPAIARIGLALSDADAARDVEAFAEQIDAIMAVTPADARCALAPLTLPRDYRAATRTLARSVRR